MSDAAQQYIEYWSRPEADRDGDELDLTTLVETDPQTAIGVMDEIMHQTDDRLILSVIGAGELEDLMSRPDADTYLEDIFRRARADPNWRYAFCCMYTTGFQNDSVRRECESIIARYGRS